MGQLLHLYLRNADVGEGLLKMRSAARHRNRLFYTLLALGILINLPALFNDVLEPDGALYAGIAKHIVINNDWINLVGDGHDWLDKPHLSFWLTAISFKFFGITPFAYKFPAFLCFLGSAYYTYRFCSLLFDKHTARFAVLLYITSLQLILCNFDVRAEGYLTFFAIASSYHLYAILKSKADWHILCAALFCALAIMTKGIFVLIPIFSGFILYQFINHQMRVFLNPRWLLMLLLTGIFIIPELYCLYIQFDSHPEKTVFGTTHVSGISFFFWGSQFGRFFNTGPIRGNGNPWFFVHTTLWALLPWAPIFYIAALKSAKFARRVIKNDDRSIIGGSAFVTFLMFSLSRFQLPHYIVLLFPHFSMITASYLVGIKKKSEVKLWRMVMLFLYVLLCLVVLMLAIYYGIGNVSITLVLVFFTTVMLLYSLGDLSIDSLVVRGFCFATLFSLFMNLIFYPSLLKYQAGMMAGKWVTKNARGATLFMYKCNNYSFEFYAPGSVGRSDTDSNLLKKNVRSVFFAPEDSLPHLTKDSLQVEVLGKFTNFHVSQLSLKFLNKDTRPQLLRQYVLARWSQ